MKTDPARAAAVVLSNGSFRCLATPSGTGFSSLGDQQLTGWGADPCEDDLGFYIYVRDADSGVLTTASGPALEGQATGAWEADATGAEITRDHGGVESGVRVAVLSDAPVERRLLRLRNPSDRPRRLELTAFVEIVLNTPDAHAAHPGFSKLFIETAWSADDGILLAARRPRANGEKHPLVGLALVGAPVLDWETDRGRFIGRGRRALNPIALAHGRPLSGRVGAVLDPVLALRTAIDMPPKSAAAVSFVLAAGVDRAELAANVARAILSSAAAPAQELSAAGADGVTAPMSALFTGYLHGVRRARGRPLAARAGTVAAALRSRGGPLRADNGYGGFSSDGSEYVVRIGREPDGTLRLPPMPWSNVLANESFGVVVTEKGAITTWSGNSRLHRLTPWRNDALADPHDEAFYVRDEDSGAFWSALPGPAPAAAEYEVRHGFGYTRWRHESGGILHEATLFVAEHEPLRVLDVVLTNRSSQPRRLSFYAFNRWVLGATPAETRDALTVEFDADRGAVLARNPAAGAFAGGIAFAALAGLDGVAPEASLDRRAFLGTPGFMESPAALESGLPLEAVRGAEPAAVLRVHVSLAPGATLRLQALLGEAASLAELDRMLGTQRAPGGTAAALGRVVDGWVERLGRTQIETPVPALDLMVNGWLVYQTIACRLWARTAFYQSGGAFGFRDQLQDAASLAHSHPELLRAQILNNAAHQFAEGDVLHWWHPPLAEGIRTKFADDLVWLPYLTARYIAVTADTALLAETVGFKKGPTLDPGEDERYFVPEQSAVSADLYSHCTLAFERAMTRGRHGLPLFGCGDWNDGMNRVGREGRGESVWMAFFLYAAIDEFLPLCRARGDQAAVKRLTAYQAGLVTALEHSGWDGAWYRRGYYDSGAVLGSHLSDDCQIDALVQAWAVISRAVPSARADAALDAAERRLVDDGAGLIRLLTPPFVNTPEDPGYIKGYLAGVRENGGQYTHAALWLVKAFAEAGRRNRAAPLLEMLSPVTHGGDPTRIATYQVEPYVIAADVYGVDPHIGRGGWTWYTGSAGWMYRVALESVLGFSIEANTHLVLKPCIPDAWPGFALVHRRPDGTSYRLTVDNPERTSAAIVGASLDGAPLAADAGAVRVPIAADGKRHEVRVVLGRGGPPT